jgi:hypothetical protein
LGNQKFVPSISLVRWQGENASLIIKGGLRTFVEAFDCTISSWLSRHFSGISGHRRSSVKPLHLGTEETAPDYTTHTGGYYGRIIDIDRIRINSVLHLLRVQTNSVFHTVGGSLQEDGRQSADDYSTIEKYQYERVMASALQSERPCRVSSRGVLEVAGVNYGN